MRSIFVMLIFMCIFLYTSEQNSQNTDYSISINRKFEVLKKPANDETYRRLFREAGNYLGNRSFFFADSWVNGGTLTALSKKKADEPFIRIVREEFKQPVDLYDFSLFLDDLLLAYSKGHIGVAPYVTSGRARSGGIILHPDDVFTNKPRKYGTKKDILYINRPKRQSSLKPARDGDPLGPRWTVRFRNPLNEEDRIDALRKHAPDKTFTYRVTSLTRQLKEQGAYVEISSTIRSRKRGYLMWGAFRLSRCTSKGEVDSFTKKLNSLNKTKKLNIPIKWNHPRGWKATVQAARDMTEAYDVVYATERGAFYSNHYDGTAVDMVLRGLPRILVLKAPDGTKRKFDLSDPENTRDVNLSPELIKWIERHFGFKKLKSDYPHWDNDK